MHVYKKQKQWKILVSKSKLFKMHNFLCLAKSVQVNLGQICEKEEGRERLPINTGIIFILAFFRKMMRKWKPVLTN